MATSFSVKWDTRGAERALDAMLALAEAATYETLDEVARETQRQVLRQPHGRHAPETRTGSAPGSAPWSISGALYDSLRVTPAYETVPGFWESKVGPTTVYSRIQELGGISGKGHRAHLPPRPYLKPAVEQLKAVDYYRGTFKSAWADAVRAAARG